VNNDNKSDKSIDTLQLEYEEQEAKAKLIEFSQSFITESENILNYEEGRIKRQPASGRTDSIIVRDIKDKANLHNLQKQFIVSEGVKVTERSLEKHEEKLTAATSKRRKPEEYEEKRNNVNKSDSRSNQRTTPVKNRLVKMTNQNTKIDESRSKHNYFSKLQISNEERKEDYDFDNSKMALKSKPLGQYFKQKHTNRSDHIDSRKAREIIAEALRGSLVACEDAFADFTHHFNPNKNRRDNSIGSCFG
jgi:hypothetical protein